MQRDPFAAQSFAVQYREACRHTDELFDRIHPEYLVARPVAERHRLLFYIGHLEAFDWNLLSGRLFDVPAFNPAFDRLFAFGIDPVGGGLPTDQPADWPSLEAIREYRDEVRRRIVAQIADTDFSGAGQPGAGQPGAGQPGAQVDPATLLQVVIEHRQMHAETLAYLIHQMPLAQKRIPTDGSLSLPARLPPRPAAEMRRIPAGTAVLGIPRTPDVKDAVAGGGEMPAGVGRFGWDNEFGACEVAVPAFLIDRHMVTNGEFLAFVDAGGYQRPEFWSDADRAWLTQGGIAHPAFWRREAAGWRQRTMFEELPLPLDWPVYVSHAEAQAYARFVGKRLPTEAQWLRAAEGAAGQEAPPEDGNFDFRAWDPSPVHAHPRNRSMHGVEGQFGNGWEWTSDAFAPLPGFVAFPFYPGYSADFFDGQHFVMKGGSPRTAARMLRPSFRNWFQPHYPYVYVGLRCVQDV
ncbi:SUMF1/EgtB/PvdO family nonheme iron enzyme [Robbsia sp. Bb-Pol-6]|uniref:SUMF1/EgtB/PvdO family nonheme iron enzyme n=1 Tax=Robbsia betulipollinis TaxID=2981849 RepID=A0ABT3ZMM6_9BURK|nr:SUMF1/EgtB/PvdO family nonheme iron enzyme [Robbsia betulipollinis]MCY0387769.1 SUMF1/EgtB/PvdO family nonheme iron enzyme [Robbsia betulipollinis]